MAIRAVCSYFAPGMARPCARTVGHGQRCHLHAEAKQPTARDVLDSQMTEDELLAAVRQMATTFHWACYHTHDSRRSEAGFPDLVLCRPPRLVLVELKTQAGSATRDQIAWAGLLNACPQVEHYFFRPSHWSSGRVEEVLR